VSRTIGAVLILAIPAFFITFFIQKWDSGVEFAIKFFRTWAAICIAILILELVGFEPPDNEDYNLR
jgi:hypothetical protein